MSSLELGLIGNCGVGALVDARAEIVLACLPRFDSDAVFCSLLGGERGPSTARPLPLGAAWATISEQ